ncbi:MAG: disulfide bond formation protein B [Kangiellaceae bacterium]|jgi:disulfide bond formation protein DsbB|nr:disulfide bond formation protein B [Kangiellaceae bacterium]
MHALQVIINQRWFNLFVAAFSAALIGAALYFQYVDKLDPCPLCIFQRVIVIAFGAVFFIKFLHHPKRSSAMQWFYYGLGLVVAGVGVAISGRHVWLQNLPPDQVPACGPALDYLMEALPFLEVIDVVMQGSGECAKVSWTLLGISMPAWMLIIFIGMAIFCLFGLWSRFSANR